MIKLYQLRKRSNTSDVGDPIIFSGYLFSQLESGTYELIGDVRACLWEHDVSANQYNAIYYDNQERVCAYTSVDGYYVFDPLTNTDPDGDDTGLDVTVVFDTAGVNSVLRDENDATYAGQTILAEDNLTDIQIDKVVTSSELPFQQALWIKNNIDDGWNFFNDLGTVLPTVNIYWQHNDGTAVFGISDGTPSGNQTGAFYLTGTDSLYLEGNDPLENDDGDQDQRFTNLHEYGHHVMNSVYTNWVGGQCSGSHVIDEPNNDTCAWSEGFADIVPSLVDDSATYLKEDGGTEGYDFEQSGLYFVDQPVTQFFAPEPNWLPDAVGEEVEGRVAATIWDIYDDNDHSADIGLDGIDDLQLAKFWDVFTNNQVATLEAWAVAWDADSDNYVSINNILLLQKMSFAVEPTVNTTPVANDDSVELLQDEDLDITLTGTDGDGDALTFVIVTYPSEGTLRTGYTEQYQTYTPDLGFFGTDYFTFKVNDGTVDSLVATISIEVTENQADDDCDLSDPTCDLGGDDDDNPASPPQVVISTIIPVASGETLTLDASGSTGDDPLTFLWEQINNGAPIINIFNEDSAIATFSVPYVLSEVTTEFQFIVRVTDVDGTTSQQVTFDLTLTESPPIDDSPPDDEDNEIRTPLFIEQFDNFAQWDEASEWDIENPEDAVSIDTNGKVAHIEECDTECPMYIRDGDVVDLYGYDSAELSFWMWFGDDIDMDDSTEIDIATIVFRSLSDFEHIETITVQDSEFERWFKTTISLDGYIGDELSVQFNPMLQSDDSIIQIDAVQIDGIEIDDVAPVFSSVTDIDLISNSEGGLIVEYVTPTATDANTGVRDVTCDVQSGIVFPIGSTTVTCSASDGVGNSSNVQFIITITYEALDTTVPIIILTEPTEMIIQLDSTFTDPGYSASDDVDGDITNNVVIAGTVDTTTLGTYSITYDVSDAAGNPAVQKTRTVDVVNPTGTFITSFNGRDGGTEFADPVGVAVDDTDRIIVVDQSLYMVQIYETDGTFIDSITEDDAEFGRPYGVAVDSNNRIITVDIGTNLVQIFDSTGLFITSIDGTDGGTEFVNPRGVAVDNNDNIIVADVGLGIVQIFDSTGLFITEFNGSDVRDAQFIAPFGLAVDSNDRIIVSDTGLDLVKVLDSTGSFIADFDGSDGTTFENPRSIAVDSNDNIIVADGDLNLVQIFDSDGVFISSFDGSDGGNLFSNIHGVAVDSNDNIIVTDIGLDTVQIFAGYSD